MRCPFEQGAEGLVTTDGQPEERSQMSRAEDAQGSPRITAVAQTRHGHKKDVKTAGLAIKSALVPFWKLDAQPYS
jgi:hypothetical protein